MTAEATAAQQAAWFERTGHCGGCGQPGKFFCRCTRPCGCQHLHPVGSGLAPDAVQAFAAAVSDDQGALFEE